MLFNQEIDKDLQRHNHDGLNSEKVSGDDLEGFSVRDVVPTEDQEIGKVVFSSVAGTYKIHVYINGGWRSATLT